MELLSPAKVNLSLLVTGRREDGYHDLVSLMCGVGLYDTITLKRRRAGISLCCGTPGVPEDESNLAFRAALLFFRETGLSGGCAIDLVKRIPHGAGLGGGSGNAATVLKGLNALYGAPLSDSRMEKVALELGADVPFFVRLRPSVATGVGEELDPVTLKGVYTLLIIYPGTGLSTAEVYKNLKLGLTKREKKIKSRLLNEAHIDPLDVLHNDLEPPAMELSPLVGEARNTLEGVGADGVLMSGSGSSVFALFRRAERADRAIRLLSKEKEGHPGLPGDWSLFKADLLTEPYSVGRPSE
ncbi:MAG: 4-(cytidine 5'-diphospho)-2-C-methyl-D-erythritol kinase [Desulfobacterales bacterium]|nr:4-(cytidine 5'-diphospho)-2-C-methyl-D-erythritol kinase [Desulfobacterales bacterium]